MKCPFVDRECTEECKAHDNERDCLVLYRIDRTNMILKFIEKKIENLK